MTILYNLGYTRAKGVVITESRVANDVMVKRGVYLPAYEYTLLL